MRGLDPQGEKMVEEIKCELAIKNGVLVSVLQKLANSNGVDCSKRDVIDMVGDVHDLAFECSRLAYVGRDGLVAHILNDIDDGRRQMGYLRVSNNLYDLLCVVHRVDVQELQVALRDRLIPILNDLLSIH